MSRIWNDAVWALFRLPKRSAPAPIAPGDPIPIAAILDERSVVAMGPLVDQDPATGFYRRDIQFPGEALVVDLGDASRPGSIA